MLDETIVTETPPLYSCYGPIGEQVRVPISGTHNKRVLHGAINIRSGDLALLITEDWTQDSHEAFLRLIRAHWRGWNLVLFEDRASQHKAARAWAQECLKIETRLLPKATPELNAMDHLWRHTKRVTLGSRATLSIEASALAACQYLIDLSPREQLRKVLELRFLTPPDQIAARYSLGCDCRSCLASTFRPVGVSIFSASSFSSRCSAS